MQIRPITDLRNTNEISELCNNSQEPVFITKNGYGDLVIMSMETYQSQIAMAEVFKKLYEAEAEVAKGGKLTPASTVFDELRKKHKYE